MHGRIVSSTQTAYQLGALIAFSMGFSTIRMYVQTYSGANTTNKGQCRNWSWRAASLTMIAMAILLAVVAFFVPESPRWLLQRYPDDQDRAL